MSANTACRCVPQNAGQIFDLNQMALLSISAEKPVGTCWKKQPSILTPEKDLWRSIASSWNGTSVGFWSRMS
jgi:hypothetical protein